MNKVTLVLDKKKIEFHLGVGFIGELLEEQGWHYEEIFPKMQSNPFKVLPIIMESSARYSLWRKGKEPKYNLMTFIEMFEKVGPADPEIGKFWPAFIQSINKNVPVEDEVEKGETEKK